MRLYTIGFTKKSAKEFFETLARSGIQQLVDIRVSNNTTLAGFTRKKDLEYFLRVICGISYHYFPSLAPTKEIRDAFIKRQMSWEDYEAKFSALMKERSAIAELEKSFFQKLSCLLCSEPTAEHCHRRLVAETMKERWPEIEIIHL